MVYAAAQGRAARPGSRRPYAASHGSGRAGGVGDVAPGAALRDVVDEFQVVVAGDGAWSDVAVAYGRAHPPGEGVSRTSRKGPRDPGPSCRRGRSPIASQTLDVWKEALLFAASLPQLERVSSPPPMWVGSGNFERCRRRGADDEQPSAALRNAVVGRKEDLLRDAVPELARTRRGSPRRTRPASSRACPARSPSGTPWA